MKKVLEFHGFESLVDLEEKMTAAIGELLKDPETPDTIRVTIEIIPQEKPKIKRVGSELFNGA